MVYLEAIRQNLLNTCGALCLIETSIGMALLYKLLFNLHRNVAVIGKLQPI